MFDVYEVARLHGASVDRQHVLELVVARAQVADGETAEALWDLSAAIKALPFPEPVNTRSVG